MGRRALYSLLINPRLRIVFSLARPSRCIFLRHAEPRQGVPFAEWVLRSSAAQHWRDFSLWCTRRVALIHFGYDYETRLP